MTRGIGRDASPEVAALTLETAALLESLGHEVEEIDPPVPEFFADHFVLYWSMLAMAIVRTGRRTFGPTWDPAQLDNLTLGLARHCRRNLHRLPVAIAAVGSSKHLAARHHAAYDVTLTPTLATTTPRVGHLDPTADYEQVMDRLMEWVAFTPLPERHRRAGDLAAPRDHLGGAPAGHDAGRRSGPRGPSPGAGARAGGGRSVAPDPGRMSGRRDRGGAVEAISRMPRSRVYSLPLLPL